MKDVAEFGTNSFTADLVVERYLGKLPRNLATSI